MIKEIEPTEKLRMIDLLKDAGVDVRGWSKSKRGKRGAAMNPKYCYEWAFIQSGRVVVLNFWRHAMRKQNGQIVVSTNMRAFAAQRPDPERSRALRMDAAIYTAIQQDLPIRVIVLAGKRRGDPDGPSEGASKVFARLLDPARWAVRSYDVATGDCTLMRGSEQHVAKSVSLNPTDVDGDIYVGREGGGQWGWHFRRERDPAIVKRKKKQVLSSRGKLECEVCDFDFAAYYRPHIKDFCEVHHRKPLAQGNRETRTALRDLAIICSNCHRVIHRLKPMLAVEELRATLNCPPRLQKEVS